MVQRDPNTGAALITIPIQRSLLFRTTTAKGNPEGRSALRTAYVPWRTKRRIEEFEAVGVERDLAGLPIAYLPPEYFSSSRTAAQTDVFDTVQELVTGIKRNEKEGVVFPVVYDADGNKVMDLTLLSSGGSRQFDTGAIIARYDQRIAMTALADFILLGHESTGSYSLGASKIDLFTAAIQSWADAVADVINTHAIPRLMRLNGLDTRRCPTITCGQVQQVNLQELGDFIQKAMSAGAIVADDGLESYLREQAGLPPAEHDSHEDLAAQGEAAIAAAEQARMDALTAAPPPEPGMGGPDPTAAPPGAPDGG
jgi:hypothetical protein